MGNFACAPEVEHETFEEIVNSFVKTLACSKCEYLHDYCKCDKSHKDPFINEQPTQKIFANITKSYNSMINQCKILTGEDPKKPKKS